MRIKRRTNLARALRNNMTGTEQQLWSHLRGRHLEGWKFRRQHPIGEYIVDFVCLSAHLVVELDGYSHDFESQMAYDEARERYLRAQGYKVLSFSGDHREPEFMESVVETIYQEQTSLPTSGPPPARRGRALI
jgi:very-short-patch-repair endonuclease